MVPSMHAYVLVMIGVISIIYGAFAALAQTDFKRLVAYSSVSHMGYVLIGIAVWKINEATGATVGKDYMIMGMNGAMFQMIGHGVSSAGMFFMVGCDLRSSSPPRFKQIWWPDGINATI